MGKSWELTKHGHSFLITIGNVNAYQVQTSVVIDGTQKTAIERIEPEALVFRDFITIWHQGQELTIRGIQLDTTDPNFDTQGLITYYNSCEQLRQSMYDQEYQDIMDGKEPLDYHYVESEYCSGNIVFGISEKVAMDLHCAHHVDGFGTVIDARFSTPNIADMKQYYQEWLAEQAEKEAKKQAKIEAYEKEKALALDGVTWDIKEHEWVDEGGPTKRYIHTITVNGKTYRLQEQNLFDVGRLINPCYAIKPGISSGGMFYRDENNTPCWRRFQPNDATVCRPLEKDELRAYEIVLKYGKFAKSRIRM